MTGSDDFKNKGSLFFLNESFQGVIDHLISSIILMHNGAEPVTVLSL